VDQKQDEADRKLDEAMSSIIQLQSSQGFSKKNLVSLGMQMAIWFQLNQCTRARSNRVEH